MHRKWQFRTRNFTVAFFIDYVDNYRYDGDDEDGSTQAAIDSGEFVAFDSKVSVEFDGEEIGTDYLSGSVYRADDVEDFWTAHRGADPMDRNCSIMRAKRGENCCIGHYFPDMVQAAISEARQHIRSLPRVPYIREGA